jgi:hypothetical protein
VQVHNQPENAWNGWSDKGKNGLLELLGLMLKVRSDRKQAKLSHQRPST